MALNHNIQGKISEEYIRQRIREYNDNIYLYYIYSVQSPYWKPLIRYIIAHDDREALIKIFDNTYNIGSRSPLREFLVDNIKNLIIEEYIVSWLKDSGILSNDRIEEILSNGEICDVLCLVFRAYSSPISKNDPDSKGDYAVIDKWPEFRKEHPELDEEIYKYMEKYKNRVTTGKDERLYYQKLNDNID